MTSSKKLSERCQWILNEKTGYRDEETGQLYGGTFDLLTVLKEEIEELDNDDVLQFISEYYDVNLASVEELHEYFLTMSGYPKLYAFWLATYEVVEHMYAIPDKDGIINKHNIYQYKLPKDVYVINDVDQYGCLLAVPTQLNKLPRKSVGELNDERNTMSDKRKTYVQYLHSLIAEDPSLLCEELSECIYVIDDLFIGGGFYHGKRSIDHFILFDEHVKSVLKASWGDILTWGILIVPENKTYISNASYKPLDELGYSPLPLDSNPIVGFKEVDFERQ